MARAVYQRILGTNFTVALGNITGSTVPAGKTWQIKKIRIVNQAATPTTFRLAHRLAADGATSLRDYLAYDKEVPARDYIELEGIVMSAGDVLLGMSPAGGTASTATLFIQIYGAVVDNV